MGDTADALYGFIRMIEKISHDQLKYSACLLADIMSEDKGAAHHRRLMAKIAEESLMKIIEKYTP